MHLNLYVYFKNTFYNFQDLLEEANKFETLVNRVKKTGEDLINSGAEARFAKEINEKITTVTNKWDLVIRKQAVTHDKNIRNMSKKFNQVCSFMLKYKCLFSLRV